MNLKPCLRRIFPFVFLLIFSSVSILNAQTISTFAGGTIGDGKPATSVGINRFTSLVVDSNENVYFFDEINTRLRKISVATGIMTTVAGGGDSVVTSTDTVSALSVRFVLCRGLAIDKENKIYLGDVHTIWKFDPQTGRIIIVAGSPQRITFSGDNGPAGSAGFASITSLTLDSLGNIFLADGNRIRKITSATGIVTTIAGTGTAGYSGDNGPALNAQFSSPQSIRLGRTGNIYLMDRFNYVIRKIDTTTNIVTTVAGIGAPGYSGDNGPANAARLSNADAIAFDTSGNFFISDVSRIRKVNTATGIITTVAGVGTPGNTGDGGQASVASFNGVGQIYMSKKGNLFIIDHGYRSLRKWDMTTGIITRIGGNMEVAISGLGGPASDMQLFRPEYMAVDRKSNVYIAHNFGNKILKIDGTTKLVSVVAGSGDNTLNGGNGGPATQASIQSPLAVTADSKGNFYFTDAGWMIRKVDVATGIITRYAGTDLFGFSGDGGPATAASFNSISRMTTDSSDNIYVADAGNLRVRKISAATGIITTIAGNGTAGNSGDGGLAINAELRQPYSVAVDRNGNVFIYDVQNLTIRRIDATTGIINTIAGNGTPGFSGDGGLASAAQVGRNCNLSFDMNGDLYVADDEFSRIRKIDMQTGIITTVIGTGVRGYNGENIPLDSARLNGPRSIAFDMAGNMYIAEVYRGAIKVAKGVGKKSYKAILSGSVFYDINNNGIKDAGESFANGITISTRKDSFELRTVSKQGIFKLQVDSGSYRTTPVNITYYNSVPDTIITVFTTQFSGDSISFALQPIPNKNDLHVSLIPTTAVRPGFKTGYKIEYSNEGTATANNVKLVFVKSSKIDINSTTPAYSSLSGDTLTWNLNNIDPNNKGSITINATVALPPIANLNDSMFSSVNIKQDAVDLTPLNDTSRIKQRITGSFDPNDKAETHGGAMTPAQVAAGEYLNYVIRFQNTGTDTAFTVIVRDTLDNMLDLASLQTISASHNYQLIITDGNKLEWRFNNILLADSNVNEPASHGYIAFRIKPKPTVNLGDIISNRSDIYFDFNQPVRTNTSSTVIKLLPPAPVKPLLNLTAAQYCVSLGAQRVRILNRDAGITAIATVGSFAAPIGADTAFTVLPSLLIPGNYTVRVEYINESGSNSTLVPVTIIAAATPELTVNANKTTITTEPDAVIISATDKKGGGSNPLFSFAKDRSFTTIIQAESSTKTVTINSANLANGDNWIYIRMKTSETCFTTATVIDSVKITKTLAPTGLIDIDNPTVSITGYPNPVRDGLTISGLVSHKNYSVKIYDTRGVMIHSVTIRNKTSHYIRSAGWNAGMYWINIFDMKKNRLIGTLRIVK